jgi:hypothetical protein
MPLTNKRHYAGHLQKAPETEASLNLHAYAAQYNKGKEVSRKKFYAAPTSQVAITLSPEKQLYSGPQDNKFVFLLPDQGRGVNVAQKRRVATPDPQLEFSPTGQTKKRNAAQSQPLDVLAAPAPLPPPGTTIYSEKNSRNPLAQVNSYQELLTRFSQGGQHHNDMQLVDPRQFNSHADQDAVPKQKRHLPAPPPNNGNDPASMMIEKKAPRQGRLTLVSPLKNEFDVMKPAHCVAVRFVQVVLRRALENISRPYARSMSRSNNSRKMPLQACPCIVSASFCNIIDHVQVIQESGWSTGTLRQINPTM